MARPVLIPQPGGKPERDAETARLLAAGDPEGLRRLLIDHAGKVRGALHKEFCHVLDQLQLDEALNQASLRAWRSGGTFDGNRSPLGVWFYVIARNCARRVLEYKLLHDKVPLHDNLDGEPAPEAGRTEPDEAAEPPKKDGFIADLYHCIAGLQAQQRDVILADLAAGGTASASELAKRLKTTRNSIYVSRTNGRKALRAALEALGHAPTIEVRLSASEAPL